MWITLHCLSFLGINGSPVATKKGGWVMVDDGRRRRRRRRRRVFGLVTIWTEMRRRKKGWRERESREPNKRSRPLCTGVEATFSTISEPLRRYVFVLLAWDSGKHNLVFNVYYIIFVFPMRRLSSVLHSQESGQTPPHLKRDPHLFSLN